MSQRDATIELLPARPPAAIIAASRRFRQRARTERAGVQGPRLWGGHPGGEP